MKRKGSYFEYEQERNMDLLKAYHTALSECDVIRLDDIWFQIANMPASRFWVSEERAAIVISKIMRGEELSEMRPCKREMFMEIYRRVMQLKKERPNLTIYKLCFNVINKPAPCFYMTPLSIRETIYKIKRDFYDKRKQHLRFMTM